MKKIIIFGFLISAFIFLSLSAGEVFAAPKKTLSDLENELKTTKQKYEENVYQKKQTQTQIANNKKAVIDSFSEKEQNSINVENAKIKVEQSEVKVKEVTEQSNDLLRFFQIANGENVYLSYIADSTSITDFIVRAAVTEQLSVYNDEKLKELEELIKENKQLQLDLIARNSELDQAVINYQNKISVLGNHLNELSDISVNINDQLKAQQDLINYYKGIGCKSNQSLEECDATLGDTKFIRPLQKGRVSSPYGPRGGKLHSGIDLAGNPEGTFIYAPANGTVIAVPAKQSCGGKTLHIYHRVNGQDYTTVYAHLLKVNVKVGDKVTPNTVIATVGGGPQAGPDCSTGAHLHYTMAKGKHAMLNGVFNNLVVPFPFTNANGWTFNTRV